MVTVSCSGVSTDSMREREAVSRSSMRVRAARPSAVIVGRPSVNAIHPRMRRWRKRRPPKRARPGPPCPRCPGRWWPRCSCVELAAGVDEAFKAASLVATPSRGGSVPIVPCTGMSELTVACGAVSSTGVVSACGASVSVSASRCRRRRSWRRTPSEARMSARSARTSWSAARMRKASDRSPSGVLFGVFMRSPFGSRSSNVCQMTSECSVTCISEACQVTYILFP